MKIPATHHAVRLIVRNLALNSEYSWVLPEAQAYRLVTGLSESIEKDPHISRICVRVEDVRH